MSKEYKVNPLRVTGTDAFAEASAQELRVLLALVECGGKFESVEALAESAAVSKTRCSSALTLWEDGGVITERIDGAPIITEEFSERLTKDEIDERPSVEVADSIRDGNLKSAIDECATLMNLATMPTADVKNITALYTQYGLSPEYIVTLAAYLAEQGKLTARNLCNQAIRLDGTGCDTVEALESYIQNKATESDTDWEFRRIFGIYNRNLSQSERSYFKKWSEEYGFSTAIVSEAYDKAVMNTQNGRRYMQYMDTVLTAWHNAGCKTVAECLAQSEAEKPKQEAPEKRQSRREAEKPRYGDFDVNEAFRVALERSYGKDIDDDEGDD
jgi:DnaD/phage-associated family protein